MHKSKLTTTTAVNKMAKGCDLLDNGGESEYDHLWEAVKQNETMMGWGSDRGNCGKLPAMVPQNSEIHFG